MRKYVVAGVLAGILAPLSIGAAIHTMAASTSTQCWDEYNTRRHRKYGTIAPVGVKLADCTPGTGCYSGYDTSGAVTRLYVPFKASPQSCTAPTTPSSSTTTTAPTTTSAPKPNPQRFATLPVGAALPTDAQCAG